MNHGIHRLVFDSERGTWIAVAEFVRGHGKEKSVRRAGRSRRHVAALAAVGIAAMGLTPLATWAATLPVQSTNASRPFVFRGAVAGGSAVTSGNTMTINQQTRTLGLNWDSFNISSDGKVIFNQPDATSRVLNRIWDNNPSEIYGQLQANGQVYLINQNGILFGAGSQVNVGGLVASALNMSETMLNKLLDNGLPTAAGESLEFAYDGATADFAKGTIVVEATSTITTATGGRVVLIAPKTVENQGIIDSGGGAEAILAAGGKVILTAPDDPNLRGLLVETRSFSGTDTLGNAVSLDGTATNSGTINTGSGGVATLAALAVNQKGIVNASKAVNINGTTMLVSGETNTDRITINQRGSVAEIDWRSGFDVETGKTVEVVQSSSGDVLYNYVNDADRTAADGEALDQAGRSTIDGTLTANGQFVLINEKGIDFGSNARVSASNFVASGLGMNPAIVDTGLLGQTEVTERAFYLNKSATSYTAATKDSVIASARAAFQEATINVASGAQISSSDGGYVILAGSKVNQAGTVVSSNGQVLLAAGADLYLKPAYSSSMRGFTAEVNPLYVVNGNDANKTWTVLSHELFTNSITNSGSIISAFGDITLVGHEITQAGLLYSSTSATANGSIHLIARDGLNDKGEGEPTATSFYREYDEDGVVADSSGVSATDDNVTDFVTGREGGKITFTDGSRTIVAIDGSNGKTLTASQTFIPSTIDAVAKKIVVENADIVAKGGNIRFLATEQTFSNQLAFANDTVVPDSTSATPAANTGIYIGDGALLDVSGTDETKSVADLFIEVELRGDEFADNPVQRNSVLRGETAYVDIRDAVEIANLESWFNNVAQTVYEKAATGGTISLATSGSAIVKSGAELDVSGGKITYEAGTVTESYAVTAGGQRYRLNDAPTDLRYGKLITRTRKEAEYVEGKSAGTVSITGHSLAVDGTLRGNVTVGTRQREIGDPSSNRYAIPYGGELIIKDAGQHFAVSNKDTATEEEKQAQYTKAQVVFVRGAAHAADGLDENSNPGESVLELSDSLVSNGFSRFDITSDGRIDIPADVSLNLAAGGSFEVSGRQIHVAGDISAPGGTISLTTRDLSSSNVLNLNDAKYSTLTLSSTASLSTAGRWVNDYLDGQLSRTAKAIDGGDITLESAYDLDLQEGSSVNVSGGGYVSPARKLTAGDAGSITLATGGAEDGAYNFSNDVDKRDATLFLDGTLSGYALGEGGTLTIKTSQIIFGETFTEDSRNWTRTERLAAGQVGAAFDASIVDRGGFFSFNFIGRDGVTVADGVNLSPDPVSWSLDGNNTWFRKTTGSGIAGFAKATVLHSERRTAPTNISLATRSLNYGDLLISKDAYVGVSAQGRIELESLAQLTVLGTLEAPAGTISLTRPATTSGDDKEVVDGQSQTVNYNDGRLTFTEDKQSESIYLGENARLLAGGTTVLTAATRQALESGSSVSRLRTLGAFQGEVLDGGTVTLDAGQGYVITRSGSLIDVSGTTNTLKVTNGAGSAKYETVGSAGGTVNIAAIDGMILDGDYQAAGGKNALGGTFRLSFGNITSDDLSWGIDLSNTAVSWTDAQKAAASERTLTVYQSQDGHEDQWPDSADADAYLQGTAPLDTETYNGKAAVDLTLLSDAGFGSWSLSSRDEMVFSGMIDATATNQLNLRARSFNAADDSTQVALTAAAVQIGNYRALSYTEGTATAAQTATMGDAAIAINALDIGLTGVFSWSGFGDSTFASRGAIHFDSQSNNVTAWSESAGVNVTTQEYTGRMTATGNVAFSAARLSPATFSDFTVDLTSDPDGSIAISRPSNAIASESMSPAGRLEFAAKTITHDGTVTAPLGEIVFNAEDGDVTLGAGSVTSVAANSEMLFGYTTDSGTTWEYAGTEIATMPEKAITISGKNTTVATGATLDLSGGGDVVAYEFTAGPGGKSDTLAASANTFAIVPAWSGFSATDFQLQDGYLVSSDGITTALNAGDTITLASNPAGLTGSYVLLPARYALLPGAYLVTVKSSGTQLRTAQTQADGSWLVNATISAANADGSTTAYSNSVLTVELANASVVANRAEYTITKGSEFFYDTEGATLSGDAGRLAALATGTLSFDPSVVAMRVAEIAAADGRTRAGRGLEMDLSAPKLLVSDGTAAAGAGWSVIDQDTLNAIGADSLLLGGTRSADGSTTRIDTLASEVKVSNSGNANAANALTGAEIMLAATDMATVTAGSRIDTNGSAQARDIVLTSETNGGDGAFLRAAEGEQASLTREGTITRTTGDLIIEAGATVAGQALVFDATHDNTLDGTVVLGVRQDDGSRSATGGAIAIGAGRINVVADGSTPADGLTLQNTDLANFAAADDIRLTSYTTLDLYGDATLGTADLKQLTLAAAGIAGHNDGSATITAQTVVLENPNPESASYTAGAALGDGDLTITANTIELGANATEAMREAETTGFAISGFDNVALSATGDVRLTGTGVTAIDADTVTIDANRVVTVGSADHLLSTSGDTTITRNANADNSADDTGLGGSLALRAKSLAISGTLNAAAGTLALSGTDYVKVLQGADIAAEGTKVTFDETAAYASGGSITLESASGNVTVESGASVSVSAHAEGGDGGTLSLVATSGTVSAAEGTLHGTAGTDYDGAALNVDARTVALDNLADAVGSGNFEGAWDVRARSGDLTLTKTITAHDVSLAADNGNVTVSGTIDASGDKGGDIALYANNGDVTLTGTGQLIARGTEVVSDTDNAGTRGQGGTVLLSASGTKSGGVAGKATTEGGSLIDVGVADGSMATGGKVTFRAAQSDTPTSTDSLNIEVAGSITGASDVGAEIVKTYTGYSALKSGTSSGTSLGLTAIQNDLQAIYSTEVIASLRETLFGSSDTALYHVRPGVEIDAPGDFAVSSELNFYSANLRFGGEAGTLTIRAEGDLAVNASISDGFASASRTANVATDVATTSGGANSWSYRLIAGADASAASLTATRDGSDSGNIELASGVVVRTGTGDITLVAKDDIILADRAAVYTAGHDDTTNPDNFAELASAYKTNYLYGGGDLKVRAGGNVTQAATGSINDWLVTWNAGFNASGKNTTQWYPMIQGFQQGFAAFGGGDIAISAGGDLTRVTAVIPTNGRVPGSNGAADAASAEILGGGDLSVKAGGSVISGIYYAETGKLSVKAGSDIASEVVVDEYGTATTTPVDIGLGNTAVTIAATGSLQLGNIYNPMATLRGNNQLKNSTGADLTGTIGTSLNAVSRMLTYGDESAVRIVSINGEVEIDSAADADSGIAPSRIKAAALNGDLSATLVQAPGTSGQLELLAAGDIAIGTLVQYDIAAERLPSISNPLASFDTSDPFTPTEGLPTRLAHSSTLWHEGDSEPSRIISLGGDITGTNAEGEALVFNEAVNVIAGGDIRNLSLDIQHANASDVSRVVAGSDIIYDYRGVLGDSDDSTKVTSSALGIQVGGPGRVEVIAGGDVELADTNGIVTRGNLDNPFLSETGASITVMSGTQLGDATAANYADYASLLAYLQSGALTTYLTSAGIDTDDLAGMSDEALREAFFQVLREIGRDAVNSDDKTIYAKGRELTAALFPNTSGSGNDILLSVSQIKTERGGDIQLLTPTGSVIVGVAAPTLTKEASKQGIFTISGGDIYAMVEKNYLVNQSRTFTLDGGDIMIWANHGDIDAGRGAKTQVATPPPVLVIRNGQIVVDTSNAVTGSGIGVLASQDDTPASDMDLFAPYGTIDAGDAGLRSTGNINLGASVILNSSNISAAGSVSGAPAAAPAAAPVSTVTSPTETKNTASEEVAATASKQEETLGVLTVEVLESVDTAPTNDDDEKKKKPI